MRRLLLLRHAKTEKDGPTGRDRDRRLDERGHRDAQDIGAYMAQGGLVPNHAFVSTAVRTRQTWDIVAKEWPAAAVDHLDELYGAEPGALLGIVRAAVGDDPRTLLVIAHNPGLHEFALALAGSGNAAARQALQDNLPTSGLAVIDFATDDWGDVAFRRGRLERFVSPRLLKEGQDGA
ncbi:histidine phosphatase family protein [Bradyrhizobium sp. U87765 SZCCT0131]|uniref:SixA phosphatase family protein n=1 Tax=unclassified Bradyrhizobium TaxID=2631580 RepID=UPI001BA583CA|nr:MULTISPECIES: histidine phosphatase family protein [unclassified Bradyrhizobium]MBR1219735.1 histidine phosphatase family protein [Bradyrhizobium sp. U87765 SZCCT0131]MBR1262386.1 histidine phosphatase family protein [Bradyrhizobium sp. U87765 SZCCT0134]MBR1308431.1 histidine phosphatase family protein [Bradyrhizobium sp. U87765 SZCCT0110]MBR1318168.1 histidine phosphatase family protein [Bradyrhizobium sp. U87765 SZCCT0109]MBR1351871.1 histidine phosphatase family protein [Bradyrhizobium s